MILVTVGGQLPFARLIDAVDRWAGAAGRTDVFAQVGDTEAVPSHIESARFLDPAAFRQRFDAATVVISHAGMGTILVNTGEGGRHAFATTQWPVHSRRRSY